ncbi:MAG TPA: class II glutamine amidotransferase [Candidatus Dormibacteraeota bacterium]|nr:class II glutamine amidotransferase [Candidatus Dormibacteraeota bacterium]
MCEILAVIWPEPQPFERMLPWGLELERVGVAGFGWGLAWREGGRVRRYRDPGRLEADRAGQEALLRTSSTHFLLHLRRPSQLSTVALADTQPFVAEDGSFAFAHNGRLAGANEVRHHFPGQLEGRADSEVGFRLFESLLAAGEAPTSALISVHRQLGGTANLGYLPASGPFLVYGGNPDNRLWRFDLAGAVVASTSLHSGDEAIFSLCFPAAANRVRLAQGEVEALGEPHPGDRAVAGGAAAAALRGE